MKERIVVKKILPKKVSKFYTIVMQISRAPEDPLCLTCSLNH